MDHDLEPVWRSIGGGAVVAAILTVLRLVLEQTFRHRDRTIDQSERRRGFERDAEARLERVLQERLRDAERRLERSEIETDAERERRVAVEREYAVLLQAHEALKEQCSEHHLRV